MGRRWGYAVAEFVDAFRGAAPAQRRLLMKQASLAGTTKLERAYWAATVESLCHEAEMAAPRWVNEADRFLKTPFFSGGLETLKPILLVESPIPFRRRNLFVSRNALSRA